jgi:hypothetical protein
MIVHVQVEDEGCPGISTHHIGTGYGAAPEVALQTLTLALMHAEWPLLLDAEGGLLEFRPGTVQGIRVSTDEAGS